MQVYNRGEGEPELTIVGSLHGDEPAGRKAIQRILDEEPDFRRPVKFIVANEEALGEDIRFIDTDLNRSFPGDPESGSHEERLAAELLEEIDGKVLDIHTTHSYPEPFATLKDRETDIELLKASGVEKAVLFSGSSGTLTEYVDGIVVEAGHQKSEEAVENAVKVIRNFLAYYDVLERDYRDVEAEVYEHTSKVEGNWSFTAENFQKVEKGEVYAERDGEKLRAEEGFYPVLMSTDGYEGMLGFKAKKISAEEEEAVERV